jgi:hypothetical protein
MNTRVATSSSMQPNTEAATKAVLRAARATLKSEPNVGLLFSSPKHNLQQSLAIAAAAMPRTAFVGASTAGEITERGVTHGGMSLVLVSSDEMSCSVKTASGVSQDPAKAAKELCQGLDGATGEAHARGLSNSTTVLLADTLVAPAEQLVSAMRALSKPHHRIIGGAPGDDGALKATYTGVPGRVDVNMATALHLFTRQSWGIGVEHGLRPVTEKKTVTSAQGKIIKEIDGKPAFRMFEDYMSRQNLQVPPDKMTEFVIRNELGVFFFDDVCKVRAIQQIREDGALVSTGDIPVGSSICIVTSEPDALLKASRRAAEDARDNLKGTKAAGVLVFSCFCRALILGHDFRREVDAIRDVFPDTPIGGFVTYAEIARFNGRLDGFHNTTVVVAAIPER